MFKKENAPLFGQSQARCEGGGTFFFSLAVGCVLCGGCLLICQLAGFTVFLVLISSGPIYKGRGNLFPVIPFGAVIPDAVAMGLPLGRNLVAAIFEDEALTFGLGVRNAPWQDDDSHH